MGQLLLAVFDSLQLKQKIPESVSRMGIDKEGQDHRFEPLLNDCESEYSASSLATPALWET